MLILKSILNSTTEFSNYLTKNAATKLRIQRFTSGVENVNRINNSSIGCCWRALSWEHLWASSRTVAVAANALVGRKFYSASARETVKKKKMTKLTDQERSEQLKPLFSAGWCMVEGRDAIYKEYLFSDFNQAFSFMTGAALLAEKMNHHPEWFNVYNKVQVTMSTHDVGGLSAKDIRMANFMEQHAKRLV